jgi:ankyrin repeat protein
MTLYSTIILKRVCTTIYTLLLLTCYVACSRSQQRTQLEGFTPLTEAIVYHDYDLVKELLDAGANPNDTTENGATPLWLAVGNDDTAILSLLLAHHPKMQPRPPMGGMSSLVENAVFSNAVNSLKILYEHGLSLQTINSKGQSLLNVAAQKNNMEAAAFLLKHGLNPNNQDSILKDTPLTSAISNESIAMVSLLLSNGANPNLFGLDNSTPLMEVVFWMGEEQVNYSGQGMEELSLFGDSTTKSRHERNGKITMILLRSGALPNTTDIGGRTPLHYAAKYCDSDIVSILLQNGADRNVKDKNGKTALDLAMKTGCASVVALLKK